MDDPVLEMVTRIAVAWLNNPSHRIEGEDLPSLLQRIHEGVISLDAQASGTPSVAPRQAEHIPAVSVEESLASKDHILSMIDGKPYKALRRHLAAYGLTPEEYRARYRLNPMYPMVAESHSATRRQLAERIGLGEMRKRR